MYVLFGLANSSKSMTSIHFLGILSYNNAQIIVIIKQKIT